MRIILYFVKTVNVELYVLLGDRKPGPRQLTFLQLPLTNSGKNSFKNSPTLSGLLLMRCPAHRQNFIGNH